MEKSNNFFFLQKFLIFYRVYTGEIDGEMNYPMDLLTIVLCEGECTLGWLGGSPVEITQP